MLKYERIRRECVQCKGSLVSDFRLTCLGAPNAKRETLEQSIFRGNLAILKQYFRSETDPTYHSRTRGFAPRPLERFAFVTEQGRPDLMTCTHMQTFVLAANQL